MRRRSVQAFKSTAVKNEYEKKREHPLTKLNFMEIVLQIERELVLSSDKASSKIPLMREARTPSGPRRSAGIPLLRQTGAIAPDHPPKQLHAWVR